MDLDRRPIPGLLLLLFVGSAVIFSSADDSLFYRYDDAFFAASARQIAERGNWLDIELRGTTVLEKPPVTFWLQALSIRVFGAGSAAARLPGSLLFIGMVLVLWAWMRRWRGEREALIAAVILLTSHQLVFYARRPVNEIYIVVWSWMVALCYLQALGGGGATPRALAGIFLGLAFMTKGIMGLIPLLPIVAHACIEREFRRVFLHRGALLGALAFLVLTVPWHVRMLAVYGDQFRHTYFWQTQLSFLAGTTHSDPWSADVILRRIAETWWPWLLPFLIAVASSIRELKARESAVGLGRGSWIRFLWLWFGLILVVFHLVYVKRDRYVLPAYPAMAMLAAWWLARWSWASVVVPMLGLGLGGFALLSLDWPRIADFDRYGDKTGALVSLVEAGKESPILVHVVPETDYCFDCDILTYYTGAEVQPLTRARLQEWVQKGHVRVYGLRRSFEQSPFELPPGLRSAPVYADPRAAVFEVGLSPEEPVRTLMWPAEQSEWPGAWAFEVRRRLRNDASR